MTEIGKFVADVGRIMKHARAAGGNSVRYADVSSDLRGLFVRASGCPGGLPESVFGFWESEYSPDVPDGILSDSAQEKLAALLAFVAGSDEYRDVLDGNDWNTLARLVNYEAEDLPLDILNSLMSALVENGAF